MAQVEVRQLKELKVFDSLRLSVEVLVKVVAEAVAGQKEDQVKD